MIAASVIGGHEDAGSLVISGVGASPILELGQHVFDLVALFLLRFIDSACIIGFVGQSLLTRL